MAQILVIDDDRDFNAVITAFLKENGHNVSSAFQGAEGLKLFEQGHPDIVISDIRMPKKDGLDLLLKFRNHPDHQPMGIILMSGLSNSGNVAYQETLRTLGAYAFFQKPFSLNELANKVTELLQGVESINN